MPCLYLHWILTLLCVQISCLVFFIRLLLYWLQMHADFSPYYIKPFWNLSSQKPIHLAPFFSHRMLNEVNVLVTFSIYAPFSLRLFLPYLLQWSFSLPECVKDHLFNNYRGLFVSLFLLDLSITLMLLSISTSQNCPPLWLQNGQCLQGLQGLSWPLWLLYFRHRCGFLCFSPASEYWESQLPLFD